MYQRILVPLDGSPLGEQVLPYVHVMAKGLQCPVALMRAFSVPEDMADPAHGLYIDQVASGIRQQSHEYLSRIGVSLREAGTTVSSTEHEGNAASIIVNEAEKVADTLIAMSTHGRSGVTRWVLGSVTDKVLRATTNPLLIIRARPMEGFSPGALATRSERWATLVNIKSIAIPLDGSPLAEQVLPHAAAMAKSLEVPVTPVGVAPSNGESAQVREYLGTASEKLRQEGVSSDRCEVLQGDPAGAILDMTQRTPDCLVAMTSHGRSGVERWVMGSVTDRVVRYSGTPVLVVRAG